MMSDRFETLGGLLFAVVCRCGLRWHARVDLARSIVCLMIVVCRCGLRQLNCRVSLQTVAFWPQTLKIMRCCCRMSLRTASTELSCVVADITTTTAEQEKKAECFCFCAAGL